ncbi:MAG: tetratricopeptide repeat protein [Nocardioides sp.]
MTVLDGDVRLALAETDPIELGARIKRARIEAGLTQSQLADGRISTGYLSRIESGSRRADAALCVYLAERLNIGVGELIGGITRDRRAELEMTLDHAELALAGGSHQQAMHLAQAVRSAVAGSAHSDLEHRALLALALCAEANGDLDEAIEALQSLLHQTEGDYVSALVGIALSRCLRESGDFARAVDIGEATLRVLADRNLAGLEDGIRLAVTVAAAHYERGDVRQAMRMCRSAIESAEALDSDEARAAAYWNASVVEQESGRVAEALRLARRAVSMLEAGSSTRNIARLRTQLGLYYLCVEPAQVSEAEECLERAARELEWSSAGRLEIARNQLNLARARVIGGRWDEAIELADHVLATYDHPLLTPEALVISGCAHLMKGEPESARLALSAAQQALGDEAIDQAGRVWFELADCFREVGDAEAAAAAYRSAALSFGPAAGGPRMLSQSRRFREVGRPTAD